MKQIFIFTLVIVLYSCKSFQRTEDLTKGFLVECWVNSYEESTPDKGYEVYRPCDYKSFPASRFRFKMELNNDGTCNYFYLAPDDNHKMKPGTWSNKNKLLKIFNSEGSLIKQFEIIQLEENLLGIIEK